MAESEKNIETQWTQNKIGPPYSAITLDTCIYEQYGFRFEEGLLATLKNQPVPILISRVVLREMFRRMSDKRDQDLQKFNSAVSALKKQRLLTDKDIRLSKRLEQNIRRKHNYANVLNSYVKACGYEKVDWGFCDTESLALAYFRNLPPFDKGKNKSEFPDAIALLSLEAWAQEKDKKILAISSDQGWFRFSEKSEHIDVVSSLEEGLQTVQKSLEKVRGWVSKFLSVIGSRQNINLVKQIDNLIGEAVDEAVIEIDYDSTDGDYDSIEGTIERQSYVKGTFFFPEEQEDRNLAIVSSSRENTSFIISATINIDAEAVFKQFAEDDEEHEVEVLAGTASARNEKISTRLLFSLGGNLLEKDYIPNITYVALEGSTAVGFGYVGLFGGESLGEKENFPF